MTRAPFLLREYEYLPYSELPEADVSALERAVERLGVPALRFFRHRLQARHYVGAVQAGSTVIEIVPKISDRKEDDLSFLVFLLSYTRKLNIRKAGRTDLQELRGSFLEIWIRFFAEELNGLLRRQMRREYREVRDETEYLRGKLLTDRMNDGMAEIRMRYPCRYEVFTEDNPLNRVLRYCNHLLRQQTRLAATQALLRENDRMLADVARSPVTVDSVDRIYLNRLNRHYEPILELCRVLLRHSGLDVRSGTIRQFAILFDMNRLFEDFVAEFVRSHAGEIELDGGARIRDVQPQHHLGSLFGEFRMNVDLVITDSEDRRVLVDTKYKVLDPDRTHYGLSQSDFYQMYGYARAGESEYDQIILLYPETEAARGTYQSGDVSLNVRTVDLQRLWDPVSGGIGGESLSEIGRALSTGAQAAWNSSNRSAR